MTVEQLAEKIRASLASQVGIVDVETAKQQIQECLQIEGHILSDRDDPVTATVSDDGMVTYSIPLRYGLMNASIDAHEYPSPAVADWLQELAVEAQSKHKKTDR